MSNHQKISNGEAVKQAYFNKITTVYVDFKFAAFYLQDNRNKNYL